MSETIEHEEWRPVADFPGYYVSDRGRVCGIQNNSILRPASNHKVTLRRGGASYTKSVASLVARAFIATDYNGRVCHRNKDSSDNRLSNLYIPSLDGSRAQLPALDYYDPSAPLCDCRTCRAGRGKGERETVDPSGLMSARELATILGCTETAVHRMAREGRIPEECCIPVGSALIRFDRAAVAQWRQQATRYMTIPDAASRLGLTPVALHHRTDPSGPYRDCVVQRKPRLVDIDRLVAMFGPVPGEDTRGLCVDHNVSGIGNAVCV